MRAAAIGECMVEFHRRPDGSYGRGFGGDTLNCALYLARLGVPTDYVTMLGDDGLVYNLASFMKREGDKVTFNLKLESTGGAARPQTVLALVSQAPLPALSGPNPSPAGEFFKNLKLDLARQTGKLGLGIKYFRIE